MQGFCASTFAKKQKDDPTLAVSILTAGPWPIQSNDMYNPPVEILEVCEKIIGYYLGTCTGMRLYWQTNMGTADLRATYGERCAGHGDNSGNYSFIYAKSIFSFQGLCLSRLMNSLEKRLLRDDEEDEEKLDESRWSSNLDAL
ncbi:hypothetical protein VitviT2T_014052 [Vitis vinifera]|uniref:Cullin family profile domain-containing protein n=1 Tax=Vitis vinifera TaxID=29760 RepID=A0ABY9CJF6_VITVI|nr:hypothetical protein VitviT2T_014052 [Vitis vinifera]